MKYVIIDDEINAANLLKRILGKYEKLRPEDEIEIFNDPIQGLEHLCAFGADLVFLDVEMPKMTGKELAGRINRGLDPKPSIVFITAYPDYSMFAWDVGAVGYILKPYSPKSVYDAIEKYRKLSVVVEEKKEKTGKAAVKCFPDFDLYVNGEPVYFKNKKAKELLALLVHHEGNWVPLERITFDLFEDLDEAAGKNYLRTVVHRLKKTLETCAMEEILETRYGSMRVNPERFDCDYYEYLQGNRGLFHGEYLGAYTWAEEARGYMTRMMEE